MTRVRTMQLLKLFSLIVLVLVACAKQPIQPDPAGQPEIIGFTATGLTLGEGEWLLSWEAIGAEVTLNGEPVDNEGERQVPASVMEHVLVARTGDSSDADSLTVGPITEVSITDANGLTSPFSVEPGQQLQLVARVTAAQASVEPLQAVTWHVESADETVEPEDIMHVSDSGLVTVTGLGQVRVYATSRQYTGRQRFVVVTSEVQPRIHSFNADPVMDGSGAWTLRWNAEASTVTLNGEEVDSSGELRVNPNSRTSYDLVAANGNLRASETLTLAPVSTFSIIGLGNPTVIAQGTSLELDVEVVATGSAVRPGQAVQIVSRNPELLLATNDGLLTAVSAGDTEITITSSHDTGITATYPVQVQGPGLYNLAAAADSPTVEAGDSVELTWFAVALETLRITPLFDGSEGDPILLSHPAENAFSAPVPLHEDSINYRFDWTDVDGVSGSELVWKDGPRRVLGWVCNRADQVVVFDDPIIDLQVRGIFNLAAGATIRCGDVQRQFDPDPNEFGQEQHNLIFNNRCAAHPGPRVETLEGIQHLIHLTRLELECNDITDISRLASMTGLVEINFDNNLIDDVSPLQGLSEVRVLGLYNNNLEDIEGLSGLANLEVLYLSENRVKDVSPLADLTNLQHIWLYLNCSNEDGTDCLRDLSPLSGLTNAVSLVFHHNEVESIAFINDSMQDLALVLATNNRITDATPLAGLPSLTTVAIDANFLTTLQSFVANSDFPAGDIYSWRRGTVQMPPESHPFEGHLAMGYNCFDPADPAIAAQIAELENRGAQVAGAAFDARECGPGAASLALPQYIIDQREALRSRY